MITSSSAGESWANTTESASLLRYGSSAETFIGSLSVRG